MIKVQGASQFNRLLLSLAPRIKGAIQEQTQNTAIAMQADAKRRAPVDTGFLRESIRFEMQRGGMGFVLIADAPYWIYIEFGTGGLVSIPKGFEDLAYGSRGTGTRTINLPARPFLIPAFIAHGELYLQNVKRLLPRLLR